MKKLLDELKKYFESQTTLTPEEEYLLKMIKKNYSSVNNINQVPESLDLKKGKPQVRYEVTIRDIEQDKIIYKRTGCGGVLVSVEELLKFSGTEVVGNFQSIFWGNPLIQRFAIDQLEENFAKNINPFLDAMEKEGVLFSNRDAMKKMLIEGHILKMNKVMEQYGNPKPDTPTKPNTLSEIDKIHNKFTKQ